MSDKEAYSRLIINCMLTESEWRLFDDENNRKNVSCEATIRSDRGTKNTDYLLLDNYNKPIAIIEAKAPDINPLSAKSQAKNYATDIRARFVYLSNGKDHYFWDTLSGDLEPITRFHTLDELLAIRAPQDLKEIKLWEMEINKYIIAGLQYSRLLTLPTDELKDKYIKENQNLIKLRDYQVDALNAVVNKMKNGSYRFLLEMATGTGKTYTCAGLIAAFLQSKTARRVLFLVDRLELETQALSAFKKSFNNGGVYNAQIYKEDRDGCLNADILISTVQSLCKKDRYIELFSPSDFDLVVVDEAHRSISGIARKLFEYFVGYKIGLTATPKNYFRGVDNEKLSQNNVLEAENRNLKDTYITFGCVPGKPTFSFTLKHGIRLKMLVNPFAIDARTNMTVELLSKEGLKIEVSDDDTISEQQVEAVFKGKDFEKKLKSEETNITFCRAFMDNAKRDPISGEIGKTIVFCVSQDHAARITNTLNKMATEMFPDMYDSNFADQVTSDVENAQAKTSCFNDENNSLNGKSKWLEDYETSKTRVCVTVAMMTTGYDCKDLLNIVLMRPIFSPSEFIQIKGRGTRIFEFSHNNEIIKKDNFYLFDFFAVCQYFEVEYNYDKALAVKKTNKNGAGNNTGNQQSFEPVELTDKDPLHHIKGAQVGDEGMRVDNDFYVMDILKQEMLNDEDLKKAVERKDWNKVVKIVEEKYLQNPKYKSISIDQISSEMKLERIATWREFVELVYGIKNHLKTREELLTEAMENCSRLFFVDELKKKTIRKLIEAYIKNEVVRKAIDEKKFNMLDTVGIFSFREFKALGEDGKTLAERIREIIPEELLRRAS